MSSEYYINVIEQTNRKEVQIFEKSSFTLINSVSFDESKFHKFIWVQNSENQDELIGLISTDDITELVYISPIIGITERTQIEKPVIDICFFNGTLYGCFSGGIINLSTQKSNKLNHDLQHIISGDKLYVSDGNKVFAFDKSKFKEVAEVEGITGIKFVDQLVIFTPEGALVDGKFLENATNITKVNDQLFTICGSTILVDNHEIKANGGEFIDVFYSNEYKFVYKSGNSVGTKSLDLQSQTVELHTKSTPSKLGLDIDLDLLLPPVNNVSAETLIEQIESDLSNKTKLIGLLEQNDNEETIREVLSELTKDTRTQMVAIISSRISKNPLDSLNISLWFKNLVLLDPTLVSTLNTKKVSSLSKNLNQTLSILPDLLSVKGKLNLITAQNHFKSMAIDTPSYQNEEDESLVIANGEDDDTSAVEIAAEEDDDI